MRIDRLKDRYQGFSLVEMLLTLVIVSIIIIVSSATLVALIKASSIAQARTLSRNESEYILEVLTRYLSNSDVDDVQVIQWNENNTYHRTIDPFSNLGFSQWHTANIADRYISIVEPPVNATAATAGNEIRFKRAGTQDFSCIGLYENVGVEDDGSGRFDGSLVIRNVDSNPLINVGEVNPNVPCFENNMSEFIVLNSSDVYVSQFDIQYYVSSSENITYLIDLTIVPRAWAVGESSIIKPEYQRQLIITTSKLTF